MGARKYDYRQLADGISRICFARGLFVTMRYVKYRRPLRPGRIKLWHVNFHSPYVREFQNITSFTIQTWYVRQPFSLTKTSMCGVNFSVHSLYD